MRTLFVLLAITLVPFSADAAHHGGKQAKPSHGVRGPLTPEEYRRAVENYGPGFKIPCMSGPRRRCL